MTFRSLHRLLRFPLVVLGACLVLSEEVMWAWLGRVMEAIGLWTPVARVEAAIRRLPPYAAMLLFLLPWAIILPVKLAALWIIALGKVTSGSLLFLLGELFGAAVLARLYALCRPALHTLAWFVVVESWVLRWSRWAHGLLDQLPLWREAKAAVLRFVASLRAVTADLRGRSSWLLRQLRAARRMAKAAMSR